MRYLSFHPELSNLARPAGQGMPGFFLSLLLSPLPRIPSPSPGLYLSTLSSFLRGCLGIQMQTFPNGTTPSAANILVFFCMYANLKYRCLFTALQIHLHGPHHLLIALGCFTIAGKLRNTHIREPPYLPGTKHRAHREADSVRAGEPTGTGPSQGLPVERTPAATSLEL